MNVQIDDSGLTWLAEVIRTRAGTDMLHVVAAAYEELIQERFDRKRDPTGQNWAALAPSTRARYAAQDTDAQGEARKRGTLLERTGQMRASLGWQVRGGEIQVGMSRRSDRGKTGPVGGNWSIPLLHEYGTARMPRRGLFAADPEQGALGAADQDHILGVIDDWLQTLRP